jgi:3-dehydroquinate synthase
MSVNRHETQPVAVPVALGERSYEVLVGPGLIGQAGARIVSALDARRVAIVTDAHVAALHLEPLKASLKQAGLSTVEIVLPPGEGTKSFAELERLLDRLLAAKIERRDVVLALGGGVIGDLAGFASAVLRRGCEFVQVPTTLLAQVDSSVGGKTGINTAHGKNLVGAFHQPRLVLADTAALDTLPARELRAGYAEVVKYGLIGDAPFFAWLEENGAAVLAGDPAPRARAVVTSVAAKAGVVSRDERETGERALLNLGHTFGHALEAATGFSDRLLHGEGVAIGLCLAFDLSAMLGLAPAEDAARVRRHVAAMGLPTRPREIPGAAGLGNQLSPEALLDHMAQDKKVKAGRVTFILARGIGQAFITDRVELDQARAVLAA